MPSARIHEAIVKELNKEYKMDEILLRIGTVAPDSWRNVKNKTEKDKFLTHFWDFRIKSGQANNYEEFYIKYYSYLDNPFYFGYLIHLIVDQYWKTYIDPKFLMSKDNIKGFRLPNGEFKENKDWYGYFESIKIQKQLSEYYHLDKLPTKIEGFTCAISELDLSGLFGESGTLNYINKTLSPDGKSEKSELYPLDDIIKYINETTKVVKKELKTLKAKKEIYDKKIKIAVDIDDTLLCTKELEDYYWQEFLKNNPEIDPNHKYVWGDKELADFWAQYREKMAFGSVKEGAPSALNKMNEKGYIIDLLSARPIEKYENLRKKLVEHFEQNNINYNFMHLGFYRKQDFLKEHNYNILIDNNIKYIEEANSIGMQTILYGKYNPDYQGVQTNNWNDIPKIIDDMLKKIKNLKNIRKFR